MASDNSEAPVFTIEEDSGSTSSNIQRESPDRISGCYVSRRAGVLFLLLGVSMSVGVGVLVHFSGQRPGVVCTFTIDGQLVEMCKNLVMEGNAEICEGSLSPTTVSQEVKTTQTPAHAGRLPRTLEPILYKLEITPFIYGNDSSKFYFKGYVLIEMKCVESTSQIIININKINITTGSLSVRDPLLVNSPELSVRDYSIDTYWQFLTINLEDQLQAGYNYTLQMNYTGPLKGDFTGLYLSSYRENGQKRYMVATQFSPTDARKAFPSFDEPDRKAMFDITMVRRSDFISLSNMPVKRHEERGDGMVADIYHRTPRMSTYVVAFAVFDFVHAERITSTGLMFRAWAIKENVNKTSTALDIGAKALSHFEDYSGMSFPLPKQDMLAVPLTAVGAMENWGLIVYKEINIIYDFTSSSVYDLRLLAETIVHEIAHQWFGNLVTMNWWSDLILKEGFAVFFESSGIDALFPDWKIVESFIVTTFRSALEADGLVTSHPVYMPLTDTTEIRQVFDNISYKKGGQLMRMLDFFLGEATFRRGLKRYLSQYQYDNVGHDDLWYTLSNQTKADGKEMDVKAVMDTWMLQMNYPLIKVTRTGENTLKIEQKRFLQNPNTTDPGKYPSPFGYVWQIPFTYTTNVERDFNKRHEDIIWVTKPRIEITDNNLPYQGSNSSWIIANTQLKVLYRVNYDIENWRAIIHQLKTDPTLVSSTMPFSRCIVPLTLALCRNVGFEAIHPINRVQVIQDAWSLVKASELDLHVALGTLEYLQKETEYAPWTTAASQITRLRSSFIRTSSYGSVNDFTKRITSAIYKDLQNLSQDALSFSQKLLKGVIVSMACSSGNTDCITKAKDMLKLWMTDPSTNPIAADFRSTYYCTAIKHGGVEEWDFIYQQYRNTSVATEKESLVSSLSCSNVLWLLSRLLEYSLDEDRLHKENQIGAITSVAANPIGKQLAWDLITTNWPYFMAQYSESLFTLTSLINGVTAPFNTEADLKQLKTFIADTPDLGTARRAFEQAVENTKSNIQWMKDNYKTITLWLQAQAYMK